MATTTRKESGVPSQQRPPHAGLGGSNVICIDDDSSDDKSDHRHDSEASSHSTTISTPNSSSTLLPSSSSLHSNNNAIALMQSILPHLTRERIQRTLEDHQWNVERAVDEALRSSTLRMRHTTTTTRPSDMEGSPSRQPQALAGTKRALDWDDADNDIAASSEQPRASIKELSSSSVPFDKGAIPSYSPILPGPVLSADWHAAVSSLTTTGDDGDGDATDVAESSLHFVDTVFPASAQSLDGREREEIDVCRSNGDTMKGSKNMFYSDTTTLHSSQPTTPLSSIVYCRCDLPAAARKVSSDGPNYGRFYLSCGQQPAPRRRTKTDSKKRDEKDRAKSKTKEDDTPKETKTNTSTSTTKTVVIHNPYARKNSTVKSTPPTPPTTNTTALRKRPKCNFFQWDTTGAMGVASNAAAANATTAATGYGVSRDRYAKIQWRHFGLNQHCTLFRAGISLSDPSSLSSKYSLSSHVRQGAVGNCWFLSALAVVAEKRALIRAIVPHDTLHAQGCYQINLHLDGHWTAVLVDSYLPVVLQPIHSKKTESGTQQQRSLVSSSASAQWRGGIPTVVSSDKGTTKDCVAVPAFCAAPDRQLWPALVEKAYAKAHGSYQQLSGGFIAEGLQDLTGAPTETVVFASGFLDRDTFWTRLISCHTAGFLMGVATARGGDGLVGGHAYSVLEVRELSDVVVGEQQKVTDFFQATMASPEVIVVDPTTPATTTQSASQTVSSGSGGSRTTVRLVRIRNPWGKVEWKGEWSSNSNSWTTALRNRLGSTSTYAKGDGTFYMSFEDMLQRFHHMDICKTQEGWQHSSSNGIFRCGCDPMASSKFIYELSVTQTTQAFVTVIQPKKRSNTKTQYWYCDPSFVVLRRRAGAKEWASERCVISGVTRQNHIELFLEAGCEYACLPFSCLAGKNNKGSFRFRLTTYSVEPVTIRARPDGETARMNALRLLHKDIICRDLNLTHAVAEQGMLVCVQCQGALYFLCMNGAFDHFLSIKLTVTLPSGLLVVFGREDDSYDVPPRSQKLCVAVSTDGKQSAATEFKFRYLSSVVPCNTAATKALPTRCLDFGSSVDISIAADLQTSAMGQSHEVKMSGGGTIDTYLWIPQLGAF